MPMPDQRALIEADLLFHLNLADLCGSTVFH